MIHRWENGGGALERSKGNKRNWILVWEDGFCDFLNYQWAENGYLKGKFGANLFFKMSHEVYNYGEGLVGKVAADNSHKWVYRETPSEIDDTCISSWNVPTDPQPKAWQAQFNAGIQTIAIISVIEGVIQLASFDKILEDLNLVISIQRKFSYLQTIPGLFPTQRQYTPMFQQYSNESVAVDENPYLTGGKTLNGEISDEYPAKSISMGWNTPLNGVVAPCNLSIPPSLPPFSYSFGAVLSTFPSLIPSFNAIDSLNRAFTLTKNDISCSKISERLKVEHACELSEMHIANVKPKPCCLPDAAQEQKPNP